jgi:hypothetical protein
VFQKHKAQRPIAPSTPPHNDNFQTDFSQIDELVNRCDKVPGLANVHLSNMVDEFLTLNGYR